MQPKNLILEVEADDVIEEMMGYNGLTQIIREQDWASPLWNEVLLDPYNLDTHPLCVAFLERNNNRIKEIQERGQRVGPRLDWQMIDTLHAVQEALWLPWPLSFLLASDILEVVEPWLTAVHNDACEKGCRAPKARGCERLFLLDTPDRIEAAKALAKNYDLPPIHQRSCGDKSLLVIPLHKTLFVQHVKGKDSKVFVLYH